VKLLLPEILMDYLSTIKQLIVKNTLRTKRVVIVFAVILAYIIVSSVGHTLHQLGVLGIGDAMAFVGVIVTGKYLLISTNREKLCGYVQALLTQMGLLDLLTEE
jgi:hypothetical protein